MSAHTPGPWDYFVGNANGRGLIRIEQNGTGQHIASMPRGPVSEADARLIAAAPDLKDFAKLIIHYTDKIRDGKAPTQGQWEMFVAQARALIAKATGEA